MADDDDIELDENGDQELQDELDSGELEADELEAEPDEDFDVEELDVDEDAEGLAEEDEEEEEDEEGAPARTRHRKGDEEDEDEDDEMLAPDDVEADLDTILKDRMVAADDEDEEEDEEDAIGADERGEATDGLQPKRADEVLCTNCFLLVRTNAPGCPVEDDNCPIFG